VIALALVAVAALLVWPLAVRSERRRRIAADLKANAAGRATLLQMQRANGGGGVARAVLVVLFVVGVLVAIAWVVGHPER
jgi:hypothetical protein